MRQEAPTLPQPYQYCTDRNQRGHSEYGGEHLLYRVAMQTALPGKNMASKMFSFLDYYHFVNKRNAKFTDVCIDECGAVISMILTWTYVKAINLSAVLRNY